jgi:hypothetical protein
MLQICDMGQTALLSLRRKACWGFFSPEKSDGFGQVRTRRRPPKPLKHPVERNRVGILSIAEFVIRSFETMICIDKLLMLICRDDEVETFGVKTGVYVLIVGHSTFVVSWWSNQQMRRSSSLIYWYSPNFTPTCFSKSSPSSGGRSYLKSYSSNVVCSLLGYSPASVV